LKNSKIMTEPFLEDEIMRMPEAYKNAASRKFFVW